MTWMSLELGIGSEPVPGYRLTGELGRGSFGVVWMADGPGNFQVALKIVPLSDQLGSVELRSLDVIREIRHSHLLAIFGSWRIENFLVVAMEVAERSLYDLFVEETRRGRVGIPDPDIFDHFLDAARGIDFLNEPRHRLGGNNRRGVQHRDIKPQNLLLVGGSVKVADYGLARVLENSQAASTGSMTPAYAPPEFFHRQTSSRSDQYSLAVAYCQMRGGRLPFTGNFAEIMAGHLDGAPDLSRIPPWERPAVDRALAKNPDDRWPSCRCFIEALRPPVATDLGTSSTPTHDTLIMTGCSAGAFGPSSHTGGRTLVAETHRDRASATSAKTSATKPAVNPDQDPGTSTQPAPRHKNRSWTRAIAAGLIGVALLGSGGYAWKRSTPGARPLPWKSVTETVHVRVSSPDTSATQTSLPRPSNLDGLALRLPTEVEVSPGDHHKLTILADRSGYNGPITLHFENLPEGISVAEESIPVNDNDADASVVVGLDTRLDAYDLKVRGLGPASPVEATLHLVVKETSRSRQRRGLAHSDRGDWLKALGEFDAASRLDDTNPANFAERGYVLTRLGEFGRAVTEFNAAIRLDPNHAAAHFRRAIAHRLQGDRDRAIADLDVAIRLDPGNAHAFANRGLLRVQKGASGSTPDADPLADFDAAIRLDPTNPVGYVRRGWYLSETGDNVRALADFDAAIRADPSYAPAYLNRGRLFEKLGANDRATADLDAASLIDPSAVDLGVSYERKGDLDRAIAGYDTAIRLDPGLASAYASRARVEATRGDLNRALADYDAAIRLGEKTPQDLTQRASVHARRGDTDRALNDLDAAIRLDPAYTPATRARGSLYLSQGDTDRSLADFDAVIQANPSDATTYLLRGKALLKKGEIDRSLTDLATSIRLDPGAAWPHLVRGEVYSRKGETDHAREELDEAVRLDPLLVSAYMTRDSSSKSIGDDNNIKPQPKSPKPQNPRVAPSTDTKP